MDLTRRQRFSAVAQHLAAQHSAASQGRTTAVLKFSVSALAGAITITLLVRVWIAIRPILAALPDQLATYTFWLMVFTGVLAGGRLGCGGAPQEQSRTLNANSSRRIVRASWFDE